MAKINKIQLSGTTYDLQDSSAITQLKTINNQSLVGEGNITIEGGSGGGGGNNVIELTQAEYDALVDAGTIDSTALYVITDAEGVNMNNYVSKAENRVADYTYHVNADGLSFTYADAFNKTLRISATGGTSSSMQALQIGVYTSQNTSTIINISVAKSNGQITSINTNNARFTSTVADGYGYITLTEGNTFSRITSYNNFIIEYENTVEGGQSKDVIEDAIFPFMFELPSNINGNTLKETYLSQQDRSINVNFVLNNGKENRTNRLFYFFNEVATYDKEVGLIIKVSNDEEGYFTLNSGNGNMCTLSGLKGYNSIRVTLNPDSTRDESFTFYINNSSTSSRIGQWMFNYSKNNGIYQIDSSLTNYVTINDTISTDNRIEVSPKEGYYIDMFSVSSCQIAGASMSESNKQNYLVWLIEGLSYSHPIQEVVDDIYEKIDNLSGGGGLDDDTQRLIATSLVDLNDRKADKKTLLNYQPKGDYATKSQLDAKADVSDVMTLEKAKENEFITASALNNLNNRLGGLSLVRITESDYTALSTKDDNTLYIVVADPS